MIMIIIIIIIIIIMIMIIIILYISSLLVEPLSDNETNNINETLRWLNIPTGRRQTSWLFTRVAEGLNHNCS